MEDRLYIASWIFTPTKNPQIYIKKYLHPGEESNFQSSTQYDPCLKLNDGQLSFGICYDIERDEHIECVKTKNQVFMPLVFFILRMGFNQVLIGYRI